MNRQRRPHSSTGLVEEQLLTVTENQEMDMDSSKAHPKMSMKIKLENIEMAAEEESKGMTITVCDRATKIMVSLTATGHKIAHTIICTKRRNP